MNGPKIARLPIEQEIISDAIKYTKDKISEYYGLVASGIDTNLQKPILNQMEEEIDPINRVEEYLKQRGQSSFLMLNDESEYQFVMGIILSSLKLYQGQIKTIQETTNVKGYDFILTKIAQALELYKNGEKTDLFLKYQESVKEIEKKPTKLFISYQQNDVQIACNIQDLILQNSKLKKEDVFVAHRDISLSEEWRKKMIEQLESSTHLLAICTINYLNSAFGNQEVGYAIAKHIKIAPIFWRETNRNAFGFLESFQSLPEFADNTNLSEIIRKILERFDIH
jgi:TIR domain